MAVATYKGAGNTQKKGRQDLEITDGHAEQESQNATQSITQTGRFASLQTSAALAGAELDQVERDGGKTVYTVSRSGLVCELTDLDAVARWLDQVLGDRP
jgi:hypothetical protein